MLTRIETAATTVTRAARPSSSSSLPLRKVSKNCRISLAGLTAIHETGALFIMYMSWLAWNSARALTRTAETSQASLGRSRWMVPSGSRW